jgi:hypothetical protein
VGVTGFAASRFANEIATVIPTCVPVFDRFSPLHGEASPSEYIYVSDQTTGRGRIEAYVMQNSDGLPFAERGDIILLNRTKPAREDDNVACFVDGALSIGNLRRYGPELCLLNSRG